MPLLALKRTQGEPMNYEIIDVESFASSIDDPCEIVFMLHGHNRESMQSIMVRLQEVGQDLDKGRVPCIPDEVVLNDGVQYTYGYFRPSEPGQERSWTDSFYIGKGGRMNRWLDHITGARRRHLNGEAPKDSKEAQIIDCLVDELSGKPAKAKKAAIDKKMVQRLYVEEETCGDTATAIAFFTEYFLIMRARDTQDLTNKTAGDRHCKGCVGLVQPKAFDAKDDFHKTIWLAAVEQFYKEPEKKQGKLDNTLLPGLRFIGLEALISNFDDTMTGLGLEKYDMRGLSENRLRLVVEHPTLHHISVSGAGEPIVSYRVRGSDAPFRFDLRLQPGGVETTITLRPTQASSKEKEAFKDWFEDFNIKIVDIDLKNGESLQSKPGKLADYYPGNFIQPAGGWPFYKPLAPDANGKKAPWFDMTQPDHPVACRVNWAGNKEIELTLKDAVNLITSVFGSL